MRKIACSALMILCLCLTACGGSGQQRFEDTCENLTAASAISMTARVQADFGETVEDYTLEYDYDGDTWTVLVTEPTYAAGITARITGDSSQLEYDGVILPTGDLLGDGVKPIAALPLLVEMLRSGFVDSVWNEGQQIVGHVQYTDTLGTTLWLDEAGTPAAAELIEKGIVKASCVFTNVEIRNEQHELTDKANLGGNQPEESGA